VTTFVPSSVASAAHCARNQLYNIHDRVAIIIILSIKIFFVQEASEISRKKTSINKK
jgi:hypothetical protein